MRSGRIPPSLGQRPRRSEGGPFPGLGRETSAIRGGRIPQPLGQETSAIKERTGPSSAGRKVVYTGNSVYTSLRINTWISEFTGAIYRN
jgi:hypothetical protein